jgi:hypothetical protein
MQSGCMKAFPLMLGAVALLGAGVSAALYVRAEGDRHQYAADLANADARHAALTRQLNEARSRIQTLDQQLNEVTAREAATHVRNIELADALAHANARQIEHENARQQALARIANLERRLADAHRIEEFSAGMLAADQAAIAALERQLAEASNGAARSDGGSSTAVFSARPRPVTVLSVGPANSFVVLDYGTARGAMAGQQLAINDGTDTSAELLISDVHPGFSIAQVHPDSLRGILHKGDSAVLTH